nr:probable chitinase 2 isoform X1 [Helicoverpa armigera]XP_049698953.1 probable chitinase 2 isoform X2 [Helicoverpa armigera]XP_049698958.1 probable chitinase 2 isoform X3 [Helicoverpa armigera]
MKVLCLFFVTAIVSVCGQTLGGPKHDKKVVCYIATWAVYRPDPGKFSLEDLEPSLCTHLVYSFAGLNETTNTIKSLDPWQDLETDYGKAGYKRLVGLKQKYPHLKVTLAIGGWNEGSPRYSNMASKPETRAAFIKSVLLMLNNYKFDGLDLDWEYPTKRDGKPYDRENFVLLVKELSEAFEPYGYILTAALGAGKTTMETAYDLAKLSRYLDLIHMMCYDYHGTWDRVLGANAPMKGIGENDTLSVEWTVEYLLSHGVSPYKMVLGLPMYGRTFLLTDPGTRVLEYGKTPVRENGFKGPYTGEAGFMGYNEICVQTTNKSSPWVYHWHEQTSTPYIRDGEKVIAFDNGRSIAIKVQMAIDKGLGGVMVWSIDTDDFKGNCNETDAYIDFVERHKRMVYDPVVKKAVENLHIPDVTLVGSKGPAYVIQDDKLHLRLPQPKYTNYALMQTINDAITLAVEEKRIMDEVKRLQEHNVVKTDDDKGASSFLQSSVVCVVLSVVFVLNL